MDPEADVLEELAESIIRYWIRRQDSPGEGPELARNHIMDITLCLMDEAKWRSPGTYLPLPPRVREFIAAYAQVKQGRQAQQGHQSQVGHQSQQGQQQKQAAPIQGKDEDRQWGWVQAAYQARKKEIMKRADEVLLGLMNDAWASGEWKGPVRVGGEGSVSRTRDRQ